MFRIKLEIKIVVDERPEDREIKGDPKSDKEPAGSICITEQPPDSERRPDLSPHEPENQGGQPGHQRIAQAERHKILDPEKLPSAPKNRGIQRAEQGDGSAHPNEPTNSRMAVGFTGPRDSIIHSKELHRRRMVRSEIVLIITPSGNKPATANDVHCQPLTLLQAVEFGCHQAAAHGTTRIACAVEERC